MPNPFRTLSELLEDLLSSHGTEKLDKKLDLLDQKLELIHGDILVVKTFLGAPDYPTGTQNQQPQIDAATASIQNLTADLQAAINKEKK